MLDLWVDSTLKARLGACPSTEIIIGTSVGQRLYNAIESSPAVITTLEIT